MELNRKFIFEIVLFVHENEKKIHIYQGFKSMNWKQKWRLAAHRF